MVDRLSNGDVFTYEDFNAKVNNKKTIIKDLLNEKKWYVVKQEIVIWVINVAKRLNF